MLHLGAADTITIAAGGTAAVTNPNAIVRYTVNGKPLSAAIPLNGATPVTILTGVTSPIGQDVELNSISLANVDTQSNTITVTAALGANTVNFAVVTMAAGDQGIIDSDGKYTGVNSAGQALTQITGGPTVTQTPGASTAAAGSTTSDAGVLPAATSAVYPTTAADGTKGVRVSASDKVTGRMLFIGNGVSNTILKVYAPSGGTINGGSADAAFSSVSGKGVIICCLSSSGNTWLAW
jgi:hypothetical protein